LLAPDVVKANEDEAELVPPGLAAAIVVTRGSEPTVLRTADGRHETVEVAPRSVVDTTGAGDAFVAGFLAAWDDGAAGVDAVVAGHAAAARVVTGPGADWWETGGHVEQ
jgi:sugar/nucleoside kinase (ribokinase family)